jgi:hypothetical protein
MEKQKILFNHKLEIYYVELLVEPRDFNVQEVVLGIDPGSHFDRFSIYFHNCHLYNAEIIQRPKRKQGKATKIQLLISKNDKQLIEASVEKD